MVFLLNTGRDLYAFLQEFNAIFTLDTTDSSRIEEIYELDFKIRLI